MGAPAPYIPPKHFDNPQGAAVTDSDVQQPQDADFKTAMSNPIPTQLQGSVTPHDIPVDSLEQSSQLSERGAPRDLDRWGNQHGELNALDKNKSAWGEVAANERGFERSKLHKISGPVNVQFPSGHVVQFPDEQTAHEKASDVWTQLQQMPSVDALKREVHAGVDTIKNLPQALKDSVTNPPTAEEQKTLGVSAKPSLAEHLALALARNTGEPLQHAAEWYKRAVQAHQDVISTLLANAPEGIGAAAAQALIGKAAGDAVGNAGELASVESGEMSIPGTGRKGVPPEVYDQAIKAASKAEAGRQWTPQSAQPVVSALQKASPEGEFSLKGSVAEGKASANDLDIVIKRGKGYNHEETQDVLSSQGYEHTNTIKQGLHQGEHYYNAKTGRAIDIWFE